MGDLVLLIVLTGGTILIATWISGAETVEELSTELIDRTATRTERELEQFFGAIQSNVLTGRDWAEGGILDATDHEAMNTLFVPILEQNPQVSSMMVANSDGAEYLLLRDPIDPNSWSNRVVQADVWGRRVFNRRWNSKTGEAEGEFSELEYDPRKRIWYQGAEKTTADAPVYWTEPVIFFITKDPGITAGTHWQSGDESEQTTVVAYDLLLMDISKFTSRLEVSDSGKAFVLVEDGKSGDLKVVGLPGDQRFQTDSALRDALVFVPAESAVVDSEAELPPPGSLNIPQMSNAISAWQQGGRELQPVRYSAEGEPWWGGFRSYDVGANRFWIGVVVPESDLSAGIRTQQLILMGIVLGVLGIGVVRSVMLARRFSAPIELLVAESERISRGDLEPGPPIESGVHEIQQLAQSHVEMREGLKSVIKLEKLERDLDIAREIQHGLLPDESPETPGFEVAGWNRPADQTGGDYFDWLTLPNGRTLFTLADVSGHGIGPALIVSVYRAYMRASAADEVVSLSAIVARVNDLLCDDIPEGRFVTAAIGIIDVKRHEVELLSAGQAPLLFYEAASDTMHNWDADDLPLGVAAGIEFHSSRTIEFSPGDMLVLTTDGFFEASNPDDEQFGVHALEQFIRNQHTLPPDELIKKLYRRVKTHAAGEAQGDDLTALIVKRTVT